MNIHPLLAFADAPRRRETRRGLTGRNKSRLSSAQIVSMQQQVSRIRAARLTTDRETDDVDFDQTSR